LSDSYYIRLGLTVRGPYSRSDLHELAARGGFSKAHEVSSDKKSWSSATGFPDLFPTARRPGTEKSAARSDIEFTDDVVPQAGEKSPSDRVASRQTPADPGTGSGLSSQVPGSSIATRPMSPQTVWAMVTGPLGFVLLLTCTVLVVLTLRTSKFAPSQNIGLMILLPVTSVLGTAALILGHLSIRKYQLLPGSLKERNLIVIGLSCGYTIVILSVMYSLVLLVSSLT
jgi:hypothetical protein